MNVNNPWDLPVSGTKGLAWHARNVVVRLCLAKGICGLPRGWPGGGDLADEKCLVSSSTGLHFWLYWAIFFEWLLDNYLLHCTVATNCGVFVRPSAQVRRKDMSDDLCYWNPVTWFCVMAPSQWLSSTLRSEFDTICSLAIFGIVGASGSVAELLGSSISCVCQVVRLTHVIKSFSDHRWPHASLLLLRWWICFFFSPSSLLWSYSCWNG